MNIRRSIRLAGLLIMLMLSSIYATEAENMAFTDLSKWSGRNADIRKVSEGIQVTFHPVDYPNIFINTKDAWDWTDKSLLVEVTNPQNTLQTFHIRIDDDARANGNDYCITGSGSVQPKSKGVFALPLSASTDKAAGNMRGLPGLSKEISTMSVWGDPKFNPSHVIACQIFLNHPDSKSELVVTKISLGSRPSLEGIVDQFGQYRREEWPGKLNGADGLLKRKQAEETALREHPSLPDRDIFGGWTKGPKLTATGYFRIEKVDGKWWLVTPEGHLFFSNGVDTMGYSSETLTGGDRRKMFTWLPNSGEPLSNHIGSHDSYFQGVHLTGSTFDFYGANLERKYGANYMDQWRTISLKRLIAWGFNTVGNWSYPLLGNKMVPYTVPVYIGGSHARVSRATDYWASMHDPFDPQFAKDVADSINSFDKNICTDKWCLGYFVDNELSWSAGDSTEGRLSLAYGALSLDTTSPAKRAIISQLKEEYKSIDQLNNAWNTSFKTWAELEKPYNPPSNPSAVMEKDLTAFVRSYAEQYFRVVRDEIRKIDPHHLYLGCRFAWHNRITDEAAAKYCDVVSFNVYAPTVDPKQWEFTNDLNRPCIIGEFHFGALDRGMFSPGLVDAGSQQGRAAMYKKYVGSVLALPAFVGCHWFQYVDEPLTGRWDGENYNIGLVDVTDTPYPELTSAAKEEHAQVYTKRFTKAKKTP